MKKAIIFCARLLVLAGAGIGFAAVGGLISLAGPAGGKSPVQVPQPRLRTQQDLQGLYGEHFNHRRMHSGKIAKIDLDGDFNYDGLISNDDPSDNGLIQKTGPGLVLGKGELTRMLVRLSPYQIDVRTQVRFELEVSGINGGHKSGLYQSLEEEMGSVGHVRVWADPSRQQLLVDSSRSDLRRWSVVMPDLSPESIITFVPRTLYVEGTGLSGIYEGDVRLLIRVVDVRSDESTDPRSGFARTIVGLGFRATFDHVLLTVTSQPHMKNFVNGNVEKIWQRN